MFMCLPNKHSGLLRFIIIWKSIKPITVNAPIIHREKVMLTANLFADTAVRDTFPGLES